MEWAIDMVDFKCVQDVMMAAAKLTGIGGAPNITVIAVPLANCSCALVWASSGLLAEETITATGNETPVSVMHMKLSP